MTATKPEPQRARMTWLVLVEEIAGAEHQLQEADADYKQAELSASQAQGKAAAAWSRQDRLRRRLATRIQMLREVIKSDGLEEVVAADNLDTEREKLGLPPAHAGSIRSYTISGALPYVERLAQELAADEGQEPT